MAYKRQFIKDFAVNNPITTTVVVGVAGFVAYRVISKLVNNASGKKPKVPERPQIQPVPEKPGKQGATQYTYGANQYADFADLLHDAMYEWGTDESAIADVLGQMKTYDDVLALIDAYGKRTTRAWYGGDTSPMTLAQTFYDELSPEYRATYVNQPLKKTGYKF
jgi:hypothetical protein